MNRKISKADQAEAIENLKKWLKKGDTIYTILRHRSANGMSRVIDFYYIEDNRPMRITWSVAAALGYTYNTKYEGVQVRGAGMDMGFHVVYSLSSKLFSEDGSYSHEAAYALKHEWL
jgi:hypothetical protein